MLREALYFSLNPGLQNVLTSAGGWSTERHRYGGTYATTAAEYLTRSEWGATALGAIAKARRANTLALASQTDHYQAIFKAMGAEWQDLIDDDAFRQIPITTKDDFRHSPGSFMPRKQSSTDTVMHTSGTTGSSTKIIQSRSAVEEQWAVWWRYRNWHGIRRGEPYALFAGRRILSPNQAAPFWRYNLAAKELRFSTYHIAPDTAYSYVRRLNQFAPRWIHGYASAIANLASLITAKQLTVTAPIEWVTLGGENVSPLQLDAIEDAFAVRPIEHYGMAEGVANFSMCTQRQMHVDEDFAGVDFEDDTDGLSRVVGTNYSNDATVLLRYDTGDLATVSREARCPCGYGGRIVYSFDGRGDETVRLPDGRLVGTPEEAFQFDLGVTQAQILQRLDGTLVISYVPGSEWRPRSIRNLESRLREYYGHQIPMLFEAVNTIAPGSNGKTRLVVKEIPS